MQYFALFLTALFAATVLVAVLIKLAVPLGFLDIPDHRKVHAGVIPRVGGIGMVAGMAVAAVLWLDLDDSMRNLFWGVGVLSVFGMLDDRYNLNYRIKLAGQLMAVLIVVLGGNVLIRRLSFLGLDSLPDYFAYPLTIVFLLGATNAMNMSDGLDGLAAGLSLLSLACIAYLAFLAEGQNTIALCAAIAGATMGFLRYNTHPASVFMGDTGSQFLGFSVGVLAVSLTQEYNTALSGVLPLLILGLPVVDTLRVMGERLARKTSPFQADRNHFHHKLLAMGLDHYESVLAIYVIQAVFILLAFLLRYESDGLNLLLYGALSSVLCVFFPMANAFEWRRRALAAGEKSLLAETLVWINGQTWLGMAAYLVLSIAVPTYLILGTILHPTAKPDLGIFALAMLAAWLVSMALRLAGLAVIARLAMYSCVTLTMYAIGSGESSRPGLEGYFSYAAGGLAVLVVVGVLFSPRHFTITPSDWLVMFILVVSASLPVFGDINYAKIATEAAAVIYALEYVLRRQGAGGKVLQGGCLLALAAAAAQNLNAIFLWGMP